MDKIPRHVVVLRFSALGDAAMTAPVLHAYAKANPKVQFTLAGPPMLAPLFAGPGNLHFCPVQKKSNWFRVFGRLAACKPTAIADLHSIIMTCFLRSLFFLCGKKVVYLHKGRRSRRRLCRKRDKILRPLIPVQQRYADTFKRLSLTPPADGFHPVAAKRVAGRRIRLGISPFARHKGKTWPADAMEQLLDRLWETGRYEFFYFGGGAREMQDLANWTNRYPGSRIISGQGDFAKETACMKSLDLMLSMDSANMHFASCVGIPVLSIWGATHPFAGFYPLNQNPDMAIQIPLACRPCSVYGNKACRRGDYLCLRAITPSRVFNKIESLFDGSPHGKN